MFHMLQWLFTYVAIVCPQCFICFFRRMLQACLSGCCICFTHMLQVFYLDVVYVCNYFQLFLQVFQMHVSNVSSVFFYVTSVASGCFKSRSGVAHWIRVGSRRGRERSPRERRSGDTGPAWAQVMQERSSNVWVTWAHAWTRKL